MKKKKIAPPSSVVHYTSTEVVNTVLNNALESKKPSITMHLSHLEMMNDANEGRYVLDKYFTKSKIKAELREQWNNDVNNLHMPFIFSTSATTRRSQNVGSIPMWKMYGDEFKGALIRFGAGNIKQFCKDKGFLFSPCVYRKTADVKSLIKEFNQNEPQFDELLNKACLTKHTAWEYEKEWRIIYTSSKDKAKTISTARGLITYIEVDFPLNLIEEICLGPLSNNQTLESLKLLSDKLKVKFNDNVHFKVTKSKISIQ